MGERKGRNGRGREDTDVLESEKKIRTRRGREGEKKMEEKDGVKTEGREITGY